MELASHEELTQKTGVPMRIPGPSGTGPVAAALMGSMDNNMATGQPPHQFDLEKDFILTGSWGSSVQRLALSVRLGWSYL